MAYWLFKSEPESWSWDMQKEKGAAGQQWDGVRNFQARANMLAMKKGERGFFYQSNEGKAVVGVVEVASPAHPDDTAEKPGIWDCVDLRASIPDRAIPAVESHRDTRLFMLDDVD